jgi:hypothetical protein
MMDMRKLSDKIYQTHYVFTEGSTSIDRGTMRDWLTQAMQMEAKIDQLRSVEAQKVLDECRKLLEENPTTCVKLNKLIDCCGPITFHRCGSLVIEYDGIGFAGNTIKEVVDNALTFAIRQADGESEKWEHKRNRLTEVMGVNHE